LYTSCVLGLRPSELFNEFLLIKEKHYNIIPDHYQNKMNQMILAIHIRNNHYIVHCYGPMGIQFRF